MDSIKTIQKLTGRIVALVRFISRSSDRSHRLFSLLKKKNNFTWTPEYQQALEELKKHLSSPPLLHTPKTDEQLYLYLAVSEVDDSKELRTLHTKAVRFTLDEDGTFYKRMFDGPLAICLGPRDTDYVPREIHEGTCRNNSGAESLIHKVTRAGYYWDSMEKILKNSFENVTNTKDMRDDLPTWRTMTKSSTGATSLSLVYGTEALILVKIGELSVRF
uniref:Uncharacterized protein LOC104249016 n=1 Tax=Nicotiana sylvestris TaxID=4096 RepID=A0A1U7YWY2_NICSY|nr:PREDICTED: uncharacterized protein LOC104249016 [Nicotiana sylvestris]